MILKKLEQAENPGLSERQKALSQGAFVRYTTKAIDMSMCSTGSGRTPGRQSSGNSLLKAENSKFPGNLYHHDELSLAHDRSSPPRPKTAADLAQLPVLRRSPQEKGAKQDGPLMYLNNLNGIGHPSVDSIQSQGVLRCGTALPLSSFYSITDVAQGLHDVRSRSRRPSLQSTPVRLPPPSRSSVDIELRRGDDGLAILLNSQHWQGNSRLKPLMGGAAQEVRPSTSIAGAFSDGLLQQHGQLSSSLLPTRLMSAPGSASTPPLAAKSVDSLNMWQGKRLTRAQMRVEQRLHALRLNPVAKTELKGQVESYIQDKMAQQQDRAALAEFAAERREQKAVEMMSNRYRENSKNKVSPTSLIDLVTGAPRNDAHPLPVTSQHFWVGLSTVSQKLAMLKALLDRRRRERIMLNILARAAITIQRFFRGFKDRGRLQRERVEAACAYKLEGERLQAEAQANAAQVVIAFIQFVSTASQSASGKAMIAIKGSGAAIRSRQRDLDMFRRIRMEVLLGQWVKVERRCIELATRRMRSLVTGELHECPEKAGSVTAMIKETVLARKKGTTTACAYLDDSDINDHIRKEVATAISKTFNTDRIINQNMKPVPKPVKVAVLHVFMNLRMQAYVTLIGLYWRDKARRMVLGRLQAVKDRARRAMRGEEGELASQPSLTSGTMDGMFVSAAAAAALSRTKLPRFRMLATLPELKVVMQQGVAENPSFQVYMVRGGLEAFEHQMADGRSSMKPKRGMPTPGHASPYHLQTSRSLCGVPPVRSTGPSSAGEAPLHPLQSRKSMCGPAHVDRMVQGFPSGPLQPHTSMNGASTIVHAPHESEEDVEAPRSFTLTLLMHRWDRECKPRIIACLDKRLSLMHVELVECLGHNGIWMPHDEMGNKLMELREG